MAGTGQVRSILAADFGSVYTRAVLIDLVDGEYRLVARGEGRTTDGFPVFDMEVGFNRILRQLSEDTGRRLTDPTGRILTPETPEHEGVDLFAISASIGRPLRSVVIGLVPDISIESAVRATTGTYVDVRAVVSLDDGRTDEEKLNAILLSYPDVVFLAGGTQGGAENAVMKNVELARLAVALTEKSRRPSVIFAGNQDIAETVRAQFEAITSVFIADNVRPSLTDERLDSARYQLGRAFDRYKETRQKSFSALAERSQTGIRSTAQGQTLVADYLSKAYRENVTIIDAGSAATSVAIAESGKLVSSIRTDLGLGHAAPQAFEVLGADALRTWLPMEISDNELRNYAMNKSLRPGSIPMTLRDLYIEHAYLRAGVREALTTARPQWQKKPPKVDRIILSGSALTRTGSPGYDALLALDMVRPVGVTLLESDPFGLVAAMGALALEVPEAVVQLIDGANLTRLGVAFSLSGKPRVDKPALRIIIKPENPNAPIIDDMLPGGHLWAYQLGFGERATVTLRCKRGLSINGKQKLTMTVEGGLLGLIFDGRGRPYPPGASVPVRAAEMPVWVSEATGDPLQALPEWWLAPPLDDVFIEETVTPEPPKKEEAPKPKQKKEKKKKRDKKKKEAEDRLEDILGESDDDDEDGLGALRDVLS